MTHTFSDAAKIQQKVQILQSQFDNGDVTRIHQLAVEIGEY